MESTSKQTELDVQISTAIRKDQSQKLGELIKSEQMQVNSAYGEVIRGKYEKVFPLHQAVKRRSVKCIELLLQQKYIIVDLQRLDIERGMTALHVAAMATKMARQLCQTLLNAGASRHAEMMNMLTSHFGILDCKPVHLACIGGDRELMRMLADDASVSTNGDYAYVAPLQFAAQLGNAAAVTELLDYLDEHDTVTPSDLDIYGAACGAVRKRNENCFRLIFERHRAFVVERDVMKCGRLLSLALTFDCLPSAKLLLESGVKIFYMNYAEHMICPALNAAIEHSSAHVEFLNEHISSKDVVRYNNTTKLFRAHPLGIALGKEQTLQILSDMGFRFGAVTHDLQALETHAQHRMRRFSSALISHMPNNITLYTRSSLLSDLLLTTPENRLFQRVQMLIDFGSGSPTAYVPRAAAGELPPLVALALRRSTHSFAANSTLLATFQLLLDNGADPFYRSPNSPFRCSDLMFFSAMTGNAELTRFLLTRIGFNAFHVLTDIWLYFAPKHPRILAFAATDGDYAQMRVSVAASVRTLAQMTGRSACVKRLCADIKRKMITHTRTGGVRALMAWGSVALEFDDVPSLQHLARVVICQRLVALNGAKTFLERNVEKLAIPKLLKKYLKYE